MLGPPVLFSTKKSLAPSLLFYDITLLQLRNAAYGLANKNKIQHNFKNDFKLPAVEWYYNFIRRNLCINVSKLETTSINRTWAFIKEEAATFFWNFEALMKKRVIYPTYVYNMIWNRRVSGTGSRKIIAPSDQKWFGSVINREKA